MTVRIKEILFWIVRQFKPKQKTQLPIVIVVVENNNDTEVNVSIK